MKTCGNTPGLTGRALIIDKTEGSAGCVGLSDPSSERIVCEVCIRPLGPQDNLNGFSAAGKESRPTWKFMAEFCCAITECHILRIPWGVGNNVLCDSTLPPGSYPILLLDTPSGSITMVWTPDGYVSQDEKHKLYWSGTEWVFEDVDAGVTINFGDEFPEGVNPACFDWQDDEYTPTGLTGQYRDYEVCRFWHRQDSCGNYRHTTIWARPICEDSAVNPETGEPSWRDHV